ncbi:MAG TPA: FAD-binding oxidoreductase [Candidatus Egerieimonas intestinavium]|uniref:FAD-binding oxidoreductase n=1 Tax=Candidatus Egerieimonas intestinavium TaxID=2840777 RepID=A0A9D1ELV0_9FIRM|nr:FAD-binding oxidoreductase [Candidatus Egerieimonas intestinavium]
MSKSVDAVVIGGGIVGLSNAYWLARRGLSVILVEAGDLVAGTSARCDGNNYICDTAPGEVTQAMRLAVREMENLVKRELDEDVDWIENGMFTLAEDEEQFEQAKKQCVQKQADQVKCRLVDKKELHEAEPNLAPDIYGAIEFTEGGSLSPILLGFALGRKIESLGGELWRFTRVTGIEKNPDGSVGKVLTDKGDILTKHVIDAAGVASPAIGRMAGVEIPVTGMKGDILVAESDVRVSNRYVCEIGYNFLRNDMALSGEDNIRQKYGIGFLTEPTGANNALIGFSKYPGTDTSTNFEVTRAMARRAIRFYPMIANVNIIRTYAGLRPWTPDHEPIISATKVPGFYVCSGHCGSGIAYGPLSGKLITQMILGEPTDIKMDRYDLYRFKNELL